MPNWKPPTPNPTPEQIAEACLRIQAGWSEAERAKRCCVKVERWTAPRIDDEAIFDNEPS